VRKCPIDGTELDPHIVGDMWETEADEGVLEFVKACFGERKIIWTYHVNM